MNTLYKNWDFGKWRSGYWGCLFSFEKGAKKPRKRQFSGLEIGKNGIRILGAILGIFSKLPFDYQ